MPEYLSPGVYVEEISEGPRPIQGVGTSTAGFLGGTERGPTDPKLVTSLADYERRFGGFATDSYLPSAVEGFFRNGGSRCYVGRVTPDADVASATLADGGGDDVLRLAAVGPGAWGRNVAVEIRDTPLGGDELFRMRVAYWRAPPGEREQSYAAAVEAVDPDHEEVYEDLSPDESSSNYYEKRLGGTSTLVEVPSDWEAAGRPANGTYWLDGEGPISNPSTERTRPEDIEEDEEEEEEEEEERPEIPDDETLEGMSYADLQEFAEPFDVDRNQSQAEIVEELAAIRDEEPRADGGSTVASLSEFSGETAPGERTGLAAFEEIDEIAIVCVPDEVTVDGLTEAVVSHCANMGDRFAVLQAPQNPGPVDELTPPIDSTYAAFYTPWIEVMHPETNARTLVPPGGHVAGIYARSDVERGVHKAPANEVVRGAMALQFDLTTDEQAVLNPRGVNCLRSFRGRGIRVWGARTASSDPLWRYVNVRRLFLYLEESIDESTQWVVFEPNDEGLWARVRQTVRNFLTTEWRNGALMGTTPEQAFYVKCDRTTMTQDDIDSGRLIVEIGVAPVKPAEFVVFRITQWTGGAEAA
jgi:hypothetical protein